ncbi:DEAD/DEAH box helicase [Candidatus Woesearchaeota archaeon]|nr:MAG: DEAD/DEAH box helicase [Candidatus Woesearchaeota archaeon]
MVEKTVAEEESGNGYRIKNFEPRIYQETIFATAAQKNTLIVLPTGLGKTNIFVMLAIQRLRQYPKSKVLLLGPTRPLIEQYKSVFERHTTVPSEEMAVFTGMVRPEKRQEMWKSARIIFSTPQGLENDIISGRITLEDVSLLGFDEAHRAVGDYSYVWIAKQYEKTARFGRIVGMTASPGSDIETISEVCKNLFIEDVEVRDETDPDVREYVKKTVVRWVPVELAPELKRLRTVLNLITQKIVKSLKSSGVIHEKAALVSRKDIIQLQGQLQGKVAQGEKDPYIWQAISDVAKLLKVHHALELVETQGLNAVADYLERLDRESAGSRVKALKNLVADSDFRTALAMTRVFREKGVEHNKLAKLVEIVRKKIGEGVKLIVFSQFRDTGLMIKNKLEEEGISCRLFVGQMKKGATGMSQKEQKKILDEFRNNEFQVLISTSVGEEGLDIPEVDAVIFYEPVPSAIRTVQRRGRTGRHRDGEVIVLYTKGTRDESYRWAAHHKERRMGSHLRELKKKLVTGLNGKTQNRRIEDFVEDDEQMPKIIVDHREKANPVVKKLSEMNVRIEMKALGIGDYVLSDRVVVEFKTVEDFVNSIVDGRLLLQLQNMKRSWERPIVIIEGTEDIYSVRNVHPAAIRGMIAAIVAGYGIPIIQTKNPVESAGMLFSIARREQDKHRRDLPLHPDKPAMSIHEQQEYIVSSLPGIGPSLARPLLKHFGSVRAVMNAPEEELMKVEKIGKKKAEKIREILDRKYTGL